MRRCLTRDSGRQEVVVKGWVRTKRSQKEFSFIEVNDGSSPKGIQVRDN